MVTLLIALIQLSALREITLAREIHKAGYRDMKYLYMGEYYSVDSTNTYMEFLNSNHRILYSLVPKDALQSRVSTCVPRGSRRLHLAPL